jgi:hypothetical protein
VRSEPLQRLTKLAAGHCEEAFGVLVELMQTASRESVRKDAALAVIALALQAEDDTGSRSGEVLKLVRGEEALEEAARRAQEG